MGYSMGLQSVVRQVVLCEPRPRLLNVYYTIQVTQQFRRLCIQLTVIFHVRPANKLTVTGVALWLESLI